METNREIARRKPPAAGLAACLRRNADVMYGSHKTKKECAAANHTSPCYRLNRVPFAGLHPNGSAHSYSYQCFESFDRNRCYSILFAGAKIEIIMISRKKSGEYNYSPDSPLKIPNLISAFYSVHQNLIELMSPKVQ